LALSSRAQPEYYHRQVSVLSASYFPYTFYLIFHLVVSIFSNIVQGLSNYGKNMNKMEVRWIESYYKRLI
jgi:hypothetical protein